MQTESVFILPKNGRGSKPISYLGESIDQMIFDFMRQYSVPGLALTIVQIPYISRCIGYGLSDIAERRLASTHTIWCIGPIAQGYVAVAAMQLLEAGKLDLDSDIHDYLPHLPNTWNGIKVLNLLQHSSGIPDYRENPCFKPEEKQTALELIEIVAGEPLWFLPGTDVQLSATNMLLLTEIISFCAEMPYWEFIKRKQIDFLKLRRTLFAHQLTSLKQEPLAEQGNKHEKFKNNRYYIHPAERATGYRAGENDETITVTVPISAGLQGFSDIWASAEDLGYWGIALNGSLLIKKWENRDLILHPTQLKNGKTVPAMAGWQFPQHRGLMYLKGSQAGFSTFLSRFTDPSEQVCITLLANKENIDLTNLGRRIASAYGQRMGSGINDTELYAYESLFDVSETVNRIKKELNDRNIQIWDEFNHDEEALKTELDLRPTRVILFGLAEMNTQLLQPNQSFAIELPLRISVWKDALGRVWIAFPQMEKLAKKYEMEDNPELIKIQKLLEQVIRRVAEIYK